jgi:hypothetical protein
MIARLFAAAAAAAAGLTPTFDRALRPISPAANHAWRDREPPLRCRNVMPAAAQRKSASS